MRVPGTTPEVSAQPFNRQRPCQAVFSLAREAFLPASPCGQEQLSAALLFLIVLGPSLWKAQPFRAAPAALLEQCQREHNWFLRQQMRAEHVALGFWYACQGFQGAQHIRA